MGLEENQTKHSSVFFNVNDDRNDQYDIVQLQKQSV